MNAHVEQYVIEYLMSKGGRCSEQELREALKSKFGLTDEDVSYLLGRMLSKGRICHFNGEYYLPSPTPAPLPSTENAIYNNKLKD